MKRHTDPLVSFYSSFPFNGELPSRFVLLQLDSTPRADLLSPFPQLVHNAAEAQEDLDHDLHNEFTLDDVTLKNNIQYVRELTNAVLFVLRSILPRSPRRAVADLLFCLSGSISLFS